LDAALIARTLTRAGQETEVAVAEATLRSLADTQRDEVLENLVRKRLAVEFAVEVADVGDRWQRTKSRLEALADANTRRASAFDDVVASERESLAARWNDCWPTLTDGKTMLKMLVPGSPFEDVTALIGGIHRALVEEPEYCPVDLGELLDRVSGLVE